MDKVRFIVGNVHNSGFGGQTYFWRLETEHKPRIGDYAIVENKDTFDLVEIIAIGETLTKYEYRCVGGKGDICKKVRYIVPRECLAGEQK